MQSNSKLTLDMKNNNSLPLAILALTVGSAKAALVSQFGILDLTANGGINPNTGLAWAEGDQYRLAFYTAQGITATSNNPADYDAFATAQANQSTLGNGVIQTSTGWTALVYVNTDGSMDQGSSPVSNPRERAGLIDTTGGNGIGGAGVPMFVMDGSTAIARNTADMYDGWSNPFNGDTALRLAAGSTNNNSQGEPVVASQNVHYSPFLDQFGLGDSATVHGRDIWTGGFGSLVNPAGDTLGELRTSIGSSNANNPGRTWNRFQRNNIDSNSVYAISPLLTVSEGAGGIPEPSTGILGVLGSLLLFRRRRM